MGGRHCVYAVRYWPGCGGWGDVLSSLTPAERCGEPTVNHNTVYVVHVCLWLEAGGDLLPAMLAVCDSGCTLRQTGATFVPHLPMSPHHRAQHGLSYDRAALKAACHTLTNGHKNGPGQTLHMFTNIFQISLPLNPPPILM